MVRLIRALVLKEAYLTPEVDSATGQFQLILNKQLKTLKQIVLID